MMSTRVWPGAVVVLSTFLFTTTEAAGAPAKKKASAAALTSKSFSANGLANEGTLTALFRGDFENVEFNREEMMFEVLFRHYLYAYAKKCSEYLPKDPIEITERVCKTEEIIENGWGVQVSRGCVLYEDIGTDLYAKPDLYAAKKETDRLLAADTLRQTWRLLLTLRENPFGGAMNMASAAEAVKNDMYALFQMNDCTSPGLKRFEDNLRLFALNQPPIRLEGKTGPSAVKAQASGIILRDQDYAKLIEDLVTDHASTWAVHRFVSGSVRNVSIAARDAAGRPTKIVASYSYDGFNGRSEGSVDVHFTDGSPDCLYFSDTPAVCRSPNRKIAAAFAAGARTEPSASAAPAPPPPPAAPAIERAAVEPVAAPAEPPPPPAPRRELKAVNYIQGIKDACLEVLTGGDRREPETSYCFCLSAASGSIPVSDADAQWLFENFSDEALGELERRYAGLVRRFGSCRAQLEANSDPG